MVVFKSAKSTIVDMCCGDHMQLYCLRVACQVMLQIVISFVFQKHSPTVQNALDIILIAIASQNHRVCPITCDMGLV